MDTLLTYGCFLIAGFAVGGVFSTLRAGNRGFAGVLAALAVLAVLAGVLRLL